MKPNRFSKGVEYANDVIDGDLFPVDSRLAQEKMKNLFLLIFIKWS